MGPVTARNPVWLLSDEGVFDVAKKARLGSGKRFSSLKRSLARKGVRNPGAVAASIGRKKYGAKKMSKMSATGRRRAARKRSK